MTLSQNETGDLMLRMDDGKHISEKWTNKVKRCTDELIQRCKAWLLAFGFSQQYSLDYDETCNPVAIILAESKSYKLW